MRHIIGAAVALSLAIPALAQPRPDQASFRALYQELVETNTTLSEGDCTLAATRMAVRLKAAGFRDDQLTVFSTPDKPKEGGLVAILPGRDPKAKAILLLAHIDVVEARRADWTRDPFKLVEEDGYFYGRGTFDDKAQAAIFTDALVRLARTPPRRTLKLALTCGEETTQAFNGAEWLANNRRELIDAEYALNEGGAGRAEADGKPVALAVQVGEKTVQNYKLEAINRGGHSSVPRPDNAITELAAALVKVNTHRFPVQFNDTTRAMFAALAKAEPAPMGPAISALLANPEDEAAHAIVARDAAYHSSLRTTCVATLVEAGHANNALAQRATANVNCRMFPGSDAEAVRAVLVSAIGDPRVTVSLVPPVRARLASPPLDDRLLKPMRTLAAKHYPGVPLVPIMLTGATDAVYVAPAGIPVYGVPGLFRDPDGNGIHGLNERIRVDHLYRGRDYLFELIGTLAN